MSKIKLTGSNSGYVEISSAADAGNLTLQLPTAGTALLSNAGNVFSGITTTGQLDINGSIDVSSTSVFNDDLTLTGASYNVLWDKSDNQLEFGDNAKLSLGDSSDLQLYHNGNNSYVKSSTGNLWLGVNNYLNIAGGSDFGTYMARFLDAGAVELYFNHGKKFETTNTGAIVTGICTATSFSGSGEGLTRTTQYSHRNVIVNGACLVAQRGTSSTSTDYGSVDRMKMTTANLDQLAFLQKQTSDGPDGFKTCFEFDVTTPENALDADDLVYMRYLVERQDLVPFFNADGTGKNFTLSFYVKAYQTGTYQVGIYKSQGPRFIVRTYTIASSGVWQRVVLNFPGDTNTSGMDAVNSTGFQISWIFAAGSNYTSSSPPTTWGGWPGNPGFAAGQSVNVASSANNYWRITGIQLELGDIATPFEHRSYGEELARCQRYFYKVSAAASGTGSHKHIGTMQYYGGSYPYGKMLDLPVPMRTIPTGSFTGDIRAWTAAGSNNGSFTTINFDRNDNLFLASNGSTTNQSSGGSGNATPITLYPSSTMSADAEL